MTQHTPGPWTIEEGKDSTHIVGENSVLAQVTWWPIMADQTDANARLIAAAPDLLAALETAERKMYALGREFSGPRFTDRYGDGPELLRLAEIARAAIAKAKEEAVTEFRARAAALREEHPEVHPGCPVCEGDASARREEPR